MQERIRLLRNTLPASGPVIYWMSREQRCRDNAALVYAAALASSLQRSLAVVFCLSPSFLQASWRHYDFMLQGLEETEQELAALGIPFQLLPDAAPKILPSFLNQQKAAFLVCDLDPLRLKQRWLKEVLEQTHLPVAEVDGHNIVPLWVASSKREYAAYTLRPKLHRLTPQFLSAPASVALQGPPLAPRTSWGKWRTIGKQHTGPAPVTWLKPGSRAALQRLDYFLHQILPGYSWRRNDPNLPGQSQLSPYLHFGQLSPQRAAWEIQRLFPAGSPDSDAFLEELIVRRELADNYCFYTPDYDQITAFPPWAQTTLEEHLSDPRPATYLFSQLENGTTADPLWNAAQNELVQMGKMHGYLRMYWAKKILEWSSHSQEALDTAILLNDRYSLDGRDPNGYAGIAWSIGGVHDRPWPSRPVFGKVRSMTFGGAKKKFAVAKYIAAHSPDNQK